MRPGSLFLALAASLSLAAPVLAASPAEMAASMKAAAERAPETLTRRTLGEVAMPTYATAKFRNVRGYYQPNELVNDQTIFCGEVDAVVPKTKQRSGWTKFVFIPGDPTTIFTDTPGLGSPEIGPQVRKHLCDEGQHAWMDADYTAMFSRVPTNLAEAQKAE